MSAQVLSPGLSSREKYSRLTSLQLLNIPYPICFMEDGKEISRSR